MRRYLFFIGLAVIMTACKDKPDDALKVDLLTNGEWIWDDIMNESLNERITYTFKNDQTYVTELPGFHTSYEQPTKVIYSIVTGNWEFVDGEIIFTNLRILIPRSEIIDYDFDFRVIYGGGKMYDYGFIYEDEDSLEKWSIIELTNDKLIVDLNGTIKKYYRK